jgi:hypothetical protein
VLYTTSTNPSIDTSTARKMLNRCMAPITVLLFGFLSFCSAADHTGTNHGGNIEIRDEWQPNGSSQVCFYMTNDVNWQGEGMNICEVGGQCCKSFKPTPFFPSQLTSVKLASSPMAWPQTSPQQAEILDKPASSTPPRTAPETLQHQSSTQATPTSASLAS